MPDKRVLDFVRQHRRQRDHRARGAAMRQLPVHLVGDGAFLQHHHHMVSAFIQRRHVQVDNTVAGISRRA